MINFAAFTPHPPIIIPEVGKENLKEVKKTIDAMKKLARICEEKNPKNLIVISPHGLVFPEKINLVNAKKTRGDFSQFGAGEVSFHFENNLGLVNKLSNLTESDNDSEYAELDHGVLVPLYYLTKNIKPKIIELNYAWQDAEFHWQFGQKLGEILEKYPEDCGLVASGDLSHVLLQSELGREFDQMIKNIITENRLSALLNISEELLEQAGECGFRSLCILAGALSNFKKTKSEILSYEGPFGVGYLTCNFQLQEIRNSKS